MSDLSSSGSQGIQVGGSGRNVRLFLRNRFNDSKFTFGVELPSKVKTDFGVTCISTAFLRTFYKPPAMKIWNRGGTKRFLAHECARVMI